MVDHVDDLCTPRIREVVALQDLDRSQFDHRLGAREAVGDESDNTAMRND
jgi:hypothetical protein